MQVNLNTRKMGCVKIYCQKHGLSHFHPTGKKCPGPKHCVLSLEGEVKYFTEQQGKGVDMKASLLESHSKTWVLKHNQP